MTNPSRENGSALMPSEGEGAAGEQGDSTYLSPRPAHPLARKAARLVHSSDQNYHLKKTLLYQTGWMLFYIMIIGISFCQDRKSLLGNNERIALSPLLDVN